MSYLVSPYNCCKQLTVFQWSMVWACPLFSSTMCLLVSVCSLCLCVSIVYSRLYYILGLIRCVSVGVWSIWYVSIHLSGWVDVWNGRRAFGARAWVSQREHTIIVYFSLEVTLYSCTVETSLNLITGLFKVSFLLICRQPWGSKLNVYS